MIPFRTAISTPVAWKHVVHSRRRRAYIAEVRWQFAKTMPQWPHEYTVREWRPDLEREFFEFVELIRRDAVVKPWPRDAPMPRYHLTYLARSTAGSTGAWARPFATRR